MNEKQPCDGKFTGLVLVNTAAVFVSLLFWAWGIWGMLLSILITAILKVVAEHVEQLQAGGQTVGGVRRRNRDEDGNGVHAAGGHGAVMQLR